MHPRCCWAESSENLPKQGLVVSRLLVSHKLLDVFCFKQNSVGDSFGTSNISLLRLCIARPTRDEEPQRDMVAQVAVHRTGKSIDDLLQPLE